MKLTIQFKLSPDAQQFQRMLETMERVNEAATFAAAVGFKAGVFSQHHIHKLAYVDIRKRFKLSAQMTVRAIGKAVESFRRNKKKCPTFRPYGAITYDDRILSFKGLDHVSLWVLPVGRTIVPLIYGEYQRERFDKIKGQSDLVYRNGKFYLYATIDLLDGHQVDADNFLGVDLGIAEIASTSDGTKFSGKSVKGVRHRNSRLRSKLQRKQTRAATRRLKKLSGRERRFATHTNHVISKQIVETAKGTGRGIALEDLKGIRDRVTVRKSQRAVLHSWAFAQLRAFITYKAKLAGVPLIAVDPRNTSRECSACGHIDKRNRPNQSTFRCLACGHAEHADINAARVIASRATCKLAEGDTARLSDLCCS